jgi:hypothetical protein
LIGVALLAAIGAAFIALMVWVSFATSDSEQAVREGRAAGTGGSDESCLSAALVKLEQRQPLWFTFYESTFLSECLRVSDATDRFCKDVPDFSSEEARMAWGERHCRDVDASSLACHSLVFQVQAHCLERVQSRE